MKDLNIAINKTVGQTEEFFPTILSSPSSMIDTLDMAHINLSSRAAIMIFTLLKEKKTKLKMLDICDNYITDDVCDVIAETLQVNDTLEELRICCTKINKEASQLIVKSLKKNNTMTRLYLPFNYYSEDDEEQILTLQDIVNEERIYRGCQVKLNVKFACR